MPSGDLERKVLEALKNVIDPEVGLNVVEMGLIREVKIEGEKAKIKMTLTVPSFMCPLARYLVAKVREEALKVPGISVAEVILIEPYVQE